MVTLQTPFRRVVILHHPGSRLELSRVRSHVLAVHTPECQVVDDQPTVTVDDNVIGDRDPVRKIGTKEGHATRTALPTAETPEPHATTLGAFDLAGSLVVPLIKIFKRILFDQVLVLIVQGHFGRIEKRIYKNKR
jgi:hypothetical protein